MKKDETISKKEGSPFCNRVHKSTDRRYFELTSRNVDLRGSKRGTIHFGSPNAASFNIFCYDFDRNERWKKIYISSFTRNCLLYFAPVVFFYQDRSFQNQYHRRTLEHYLSIISSFLLDSMENNAVLPSEDRFCKLRIPQPMDDTPMLPSP